MACRIMSASPAPRRCILRVPSRLRRGLKRLDQEESYWETLRQPKVIPWGSIQISAFQFSMQNFKAKQSLEQPVAAMSPMATGIISQLHGMELHGQCGPSRM